VNIQGARATVYRLGDRLNKLIAWHPCATRTPQADRLFGAGRSYPARYQPRRRRCDPKDFAALVCKRPSCAAQDRPSYGHHSHVTPGARVLYCLSWFTRPDTCPASPPIPRSGGFRFPDYETICFSVFCP